VPGSIKNIGKNKWQVRLYVGKRADGKRNYKSKTINGIRKDAEKALMEMVSMKHKGNCPSKTSITFSEYVDKWLEGKEADVKPKTLKDYKNHNRLHIKPYLGNYTLQKISRDDIQGFVKELDNKDLSYRSKKYILFVVESSLTEALDNEIISKTPYKNIKVKSGLKKEMLVLTTDEAKRFLKVAELSTHKALFTLLLLTGMRPSEAYGLKWQDISFDAKTISIRRKIDRNPEALNEWIFGKLKNDQSRRMIPIPQEVVDDLIEVKKTQDHIKKGNKRFIDNGLVFCNTEGNPWSESSLIKNHFKPLLKTEGLPNIRLYDLRHTHATLMLSENQPVKVVSERLGHSSIRTTLDTYAHVLPGMQEEATNALCAKLFEKDDLGN
jgi:integrase